MKRISSISLLSLAILLLFAWLTPSGADEHPYIGSSNCRKCHIKEYRSWSETKMAKAFDVLKPGERAEAKTKAGLDPNKDYTTDKTCVKCHVTGFGKPGGFVDLKTTPDLVGVGCEMCHGPGGTYTQDGYMTLQNREYKRADLVKVGLVGEVTQAQCVTCHNAESPFVPDGFVFDFAANKDKGTHEVFPLKYPH